MTPVLKSPVMDKHGFPSIANAQTPTHWRTVRLKYVVTMLGGGTPSKDEPSFWGGDIPWVSPKDMKVRLVTDTEDHITERGLDDSATRLASSGAVLIVVRSGILKHSIPVGMAARTLALNQDMKALVCSPEIDPRFLYYLLSQHSEHLLTLWRKVGATVESLDVDLLRNTVIPVAPLLEQRAIADYLDRETARIDTLVLKKRRLIEVLGEKRKALIAAHVAGEGQAASQLFVALRRVCALIRDGTHQPPSRTEDGYRLLSVRNLVGGRFVILDDDSLISRSDLEELQRSLTVLPGDVLLAIVGATIGKTAIVEPGMPPFAIQRSLAVFRPRADRVSAEYLRYVFESEWFQKLLWSNVGYSAQPGIYLTALAAFKIPLPSLVDQALLVDDLNRSTERLQALTHQLEKQIQKLEERRRSLVTAVVTGQIDVSKVAA